MQVIYYCFDIVIGSNLLRFRIGNSTMCRISVTTNCCSQPSLSVMQSWLKMWWSKILHHSKITTINYLKQVILWWDRTHFSWVAMNGKLNEKVLVHRFRWPRFDWILIHYLIIIYLELIPAVNFVPNRSKLYSRWCKELVRNSSIIWKHYLRSKILKRLM